MQVFLKVLIFLHVIAGISALISGGVAMMYKKQVEKHRVAGKIYFWMMTFIFISGMYLAVYRKNLFFIFISFLVYHQIVSAYRALKLRNLHLGQSPELIDWLIEGIAGVANLCFVVFAAYWYSTGRQSDAIIPLVFGSLGMRAVFQNLRVLIKKPNDPTIWLQRHVGNMMGSYIGATTAFLVNQSPHIPLPAVVLWLAPTFIMTPMIMIELRKIRGKKVIATV